MLSIGTPKKLQRQVTISIRVDSIVDEEGQDDAENAASGGWIRKDQGGGGSNVQHLDLVSATPVKEGRKERTVEVNYQEYKASPQKSESNRLFKNDIENRITNMKECEEPDFKIA